MSLKKTDNILNGSTNKTSLQKSSRDSGSPLTKCLKNTKQQFIDILCEEIPKDQFMQEVMGEFLVNTKICRLCNTEYVFNEHQQHHQNGFCTRRCEQRFFDIERYKQRPFTVKMD